MAEPVQRRLAAILAADVAGYSRMMAEDEEGTLRTLGAYRSAISDLTAEHAGSVFGTAGDSVVAEFASAVQAVRAAVAIQRALHRRNADLAERRRMEFRIGINLGDVVAEGDDLLGDGVNVAARLQEVAAPAGICISGTMREHIEGKLSFPITPLGERALKNIPKPVQVYRVDWQPADPAATGILGGALALPDKPSVAVLPFNNLSGDPSHEYFSDGITEDIITELSRFSELFVIARNSSFQYKGKAADVRQVGRELGVRYVLEGSVRREGGRVRIAAQLIDAGTGAHRWAERYDRELKDVFALQDEVARTIVAILASHVNKAEIERTLLKPPATWQAYEYYMRAADTMASYMTSWKVEELYEVRRHLESSISIDPNYARACATLSWTYLTAWIQPMDADHLSSAALDRAYQLARKAMQLDPTLPQAYAELGYVLVRRREYEAGIAAFEKAVALNPNFTDWRFAGVLVYAGEPARAIEVAKAHIRLDPFYGPLALFWLGGAHYMLKRYSEALPPYRECVSRAPND